MKQEEGQNEGPEPGLEQWANLDYIPGTTATPFVSFTPGNTQREESCLGFPSSSASITVKRQLEPTHDSSEPKRPKRSQDVLGGYGAVSSSTLQPGEATMMVEGPSFSGQDFEPQWETAPFLTQADFYHPTPPNTDSTLQPYTQPADPGHAFTFDFGGYQASDGGLSTVPFPDCLPPVQSYPEYEHATNGPTAQAGLPLREAKVQPIGSPHSDQTLAEEDPDMNHISALHRFLSFNASQRAAKQSTAVQPQNPDSAIDSIGNEIDNDFDDSLVEEMAQLVEPHPEISHQLPPSSVVRDMDRDSDTEIFDPRLQKSPASDSKSPGHQVEANNSETFEGEDLLSSDVDWDDIFKSVDHMSPPLPVSNTTSPGAQNNTLIGNARTGSSGKDIAISKIQSTPSNQPIQTFAAYNSPGTTPKIPHKMRTFFRLAELVNEGQRRLNDKPPPIFEFYGWVIQSWRERDSDVQHFYFLDLYKKDDICLRGTLNGWTANGDLDKQSTAFLSLDGKTKETLCRCVCRVQRDQNTDLCLVVRFIRPATWAEIGSKKDSTA